MTVTTTANSVTYDGNGIATTFDVPFQFFDPTDLIVTERVVSTGAETVLALTTDYTVSGGGGDVGQVVANNAPPATVKWNIRRATSQTQLIDYTDHDPFPAETHETGLDRVTLIAQDSASEASRSLTFPSTDDSDLSAVIPNSVLRASKYLAFDSSGEPIATAGPTGDSGVPVSSFISGQLFDDSDAAAARATLNAAGTGVANTFTGSNTFQGVNTHTAQVRFAKGVDVASASTLTLGTDGNYFDVTGTTAVASINALGVGTVVRLHFDDALTLNHNSSNLVLPGGANIVTSAGDEVEFLEYASGQWRCTAYLRASALPFRSYCNTGTYTGDGTTSQAITGIGFRPKYLRIWVRVTVNAAALPVFETTDTIIDDSPDGLAILHPGLNVPHQSETNTIISLDADGFTVDDDGADGHPNKLGTVYNYLAQA